MLSAPLLAMLGDGLVGRYPRRGGIWLWEGAHRAIWAVHGQSMAAALADDHERFGRLEDFVDDDEEKPTDEEIPF